MTRLRVSLEEATPFGQWVREHPAIESRQSGLTVTDIDWCFHKYAPHVDSLGTREVQLMLFLELKCYNAEPRPSQLETLSELHQLLCSKKKVQRPGRSATMLWHFGVYVLSLPCVSPEQSASCRWGHFGEDGRLAWRQISSQLLPQILGFTRRPDTLERLDLRRHHAFTAFISRDKVPLGFTVDTLVIKRS
jgi:hypothetical protein